MTHWDHLAPRAVVPSDEMFDGPDVVLASQALVASSPSAFGLGVYKSLPEAYDDGEDPALTVALPLFYVSERVAQDRSVGAHKGNPPGVVAGWYLVAAPDELFEVRISPLAGEDSVANTSSSADMLIASVFVDGIEASPGGHAYTRGTIGYE
jgi:hypothetical protein